MRLILAVCLVLSEACHSYTYYAREMREDSLGTQRELLAYWRVTDRVFWFDESSEGVVLKLACSTFTMEFEEQPQGILFRSDDSWENARDTGGVSTCGRVVGVQHVKDVHVGDPLHIEIWCTPASKEEFTLPGPYLPPGSYAFRRVERQRGDVDVGPCVSEPFVKCAECGSEARPSSSGPSVPDGGRCPSER